MLRFPDGSVKGQPDVYWTGDYSNVFGNGAIERFVLSVLNALNWNGWYYMPKSDGDNPLQELVSVLMRSTSFSEADALKCIERGHFILGTVAYRQQILSKTLLLPQDDLLFTSGLTPFFPKEKLPPWETRKPMVFWRGACSGNFAPNRFLRAKVVETLFNNPRCDVKLIRKWNENATIPEAYFGDPVSMQTFLHHQYILIIDGNGISSSHTWVFASGAVPILISNSACWFMRHMTPFQHYVPVKYDLSDIHEILHWLFQNPVKAQQIAEQAYLRAQTVFSPEFQQNDLRTRLESFCKP
jgi:hypothetical protein